MKRFISMLLTVTMLAAMLLAGFAIAEPETAALPQIGDIVNGFEVIDAREFPMIDAQVIQFEHQKTGAQLFYIANDDNNRVFDLTFLTRAIDNTGLPHVFEHATTDGSEKYPAKSLFFNLVYQTYNSYMNAATYDHMTIYPVASLSEAQLLKYADFYTDSCLHPIIMENESIFREEAWRYRMADENSSLTIEGTVYSEMLGAMSLERWASVYAMRTLFPGSTIGNIAGGDPAYIPDMTWETLKAYHDMYYHPSNCIAYLYGEFEDYTAFLALLDEAFSPYERREFTFDDPDYVRITEPQVAEFPYAAESGADVTSACSIYYAILCPDVDEQTEKVLDTLTDLFNAASSDLNQRLQSVLPTCSFGSYIEVTGPDDAIIFVINNAGRYDADIFRQTVDEELARVAENGFPSALVDDVQAAVALSTKLMREDASVGVETIVPSLAYYYAANGNPWGYIDYLDDIDSMNVWNDEGLYARAAADYLSGSKLTALVTTYPEPGLLEQNDAAEAERLAAVKDSMTAEEIASIVAASNAETEAEDTTAMVASLQAVTVESLPEEVHEYEITESLRDDGTRHIDAIAGVDGVGSVKLLLDASGISQEDLLWYMLYTDVIGSVDTASYTKAEIASLATRYMYNGSISPAMLLNKENIDDYRPVLSLNWTVLDTDLAESYDLMYEIAFESDMTNISQVADAVRAADASMNSSIVSNAYVVQLYRTIAQKSRTYAYYSYLHGIDYYNFLEQVIEMLDSAPDVVVEKLQQIQTQLNNRSGAITAYAGSEEGIEINRPIADAFLTKLGEADIETQIYDLPTADGVEGIIVDGSVYYNGIFATFEELGLDGYDGAMDAITSYVLDAYLMPQLRDQYGAYGVMHSTVGEFGMYIVTYRDPNIVESFRVFDGLGDQIAAADIDQDTLNGYILSAYNNYAMSDGELSGAAGAISEYLQGYTPADTLLTMEQLKAVTPEYVRQFADVYNMLSQNGLRSTSGGASGINANAEFYDSILNPFSAVDASIIEFEDVSEDSPLYEAVRFAYESGLMPPTGETVFGVNEAATNGDFIGALYGLIGGDARDTESGYALFVEYDITANDLELDAELSAETADKILAGFCTALDIPVFETGLPETPTRGDLAQTLMAMVDGLE